MNNLPIYSSGSKEDKEIITNKIFMCSGCDDMLEVDFFYKTIFLFEGEKIQKCLCRQCLKKEKSSPNEIYAEIVYVSVSQEIPQDSIPYLVGSPSIHNVKGDLSVFQAHKLKSERSNFSKCKYAILSDCNNLQLEEGYIGKTDAKRDRELNMALDSDKELNDFFDKIKTAEIAYDKKKLLE